MSELKWINIRNIVIDNIPLNKSTLDLAMAISTGELDIETLPPITVELIQGAYILKDGRHRYSAFKLNGLEKIYAKVYIDKRNEK